MSLMDIRHPDYLGMAPNYAKWRLTYKGGDEFIKRYLVRLSNRESHQEFCDRRDMSYCPAFAKSTLNDVKNSIYQKFDEIKRQGGSKSYMDACVGLQGGVDKRHRTMNAFIGTILLEDLLVCAKVGVYIDMEPLPPNASVADSAGKHPYLYKYRAEDILSWDWDDQYKITAVLLQDHNKIVDPVTKLVTGTACTLRHIYINDNGRVQIDFYKPPEGTSTEMLMKSVILDAKITEIPFVIGEITDSLLNDVANYQISMLNIASSDVAYLVKANFPFYVEQYDPRVELAIKKEGSANEAQNKEIRVGVAAGRRIPKGLDMPAFISPSSEPITASMAKQERMVEEIRMLINLTLSNIKSKMASAESKQVDSKGLEAGLAYIGLELQYLEARIATLWAMYEGSKPATVIYPCKWAVPGSDEINAEIDRNDKLISKSPSLTYRKTLAKKNAELLLSDYASREDMEKIQGEIDAAPVINSDLELLQIAIEVGLCDLETASKASCFPEGSVEKAKKEHAERLARIAAAQTPVSGVADTKTGAKPDVTTSESTIPVTRGEGK